MIIIISLLHPWSIHFISISVATYTSSSAWEGWGVDGTVDCIGLGETCRSVSQSVSQSASRSIRIYMHAVIDMACKSDDASFEILFHDVAGGVVVCGCGEMLRAGHMCSLSTIDKLVVSRCGYKAWNRSGCSICYKRHGYQMHLDATYEDQDKVYRCRGCDDSVSCCICPMYVAIDGEDKCKNCKELWSSRCSPMDTAKCSYCTFDGVSCTGGGFLGSDGVFKCKSCKEKWDGRCLGCGADMMLSFDIGAGDEVWDKCCNLCGMYWDSETCRLCLFDGGEMTKVDTETLYDLR